MTLLAGDKLGPYEILSPLGAGGMGEVYKARDSRLKRLVAIKVLPAERVADEGRRRRFIQEAKAASALNHPNIITIHDIASDNGRDYLVMEYVQGKTLDALIPRSGMRLGELLKIAIQIAEGLSKAHGAGIIHRDLKPSNIMVSEDGLVKILDFGLAKLTEPSPLSENDETRTIRSKTEDGTVMGTAAYMSPEQAEAKPLDARSDIFSFGAVLYEAATGQRAFPGDSQAAILAAVLNKDPKPLSEVAPGVPNEFERVVLRCLRKEPVKRQQHMTDVKVLLEELKEESASGRLTAAPVTVRQTRAKLAWIAAGLTVLAGAALGVWLLRPRTETATTPLQAVPLTSYPGSEEFPSLSPDGNQVAFSWDGEKQDNTDIYVKTVGPGTPLRLTTHPASDVSPAWSPDGRWMAFVRTPRGKLQIILIPPLGGPEKVLAELDTHRIVPGPYLAWSPDGKWLAGPCKEAAEEALRVCLFSIESGEKRTLTSPPANFVGDTSPAISPDGRSLAFGRVASGGLPSSVQTPYGADDLYVLRLTSFLTAEGEPKKLTPEIGGLRGAVWTPDGREILYSARGVLWRTAATGSAKPESLAFAVGGASHPVISGSNRRLVYSWGFNDTNIWRVELASPTRAVTRSALISSSRAESMPDYSADGKKIAFLSDRSGSMEVWKCQSDGLNSTQLTSLGGPAVTSARWSPDGKYIVFDARVAGNNQDIYVVSSDGGKIQRLTADPSTDTKASWSRDGRWIYFASLRTGQYQLWKIPWAPGASREGEAVQVTKKGGYLSVESADGRFVYYANSNNVPGLSRVPAQGDEEIQVLPALNAPGSFAVVEQGIYFIPPRNADRTCSIQFLEIATGKLFTVATIDKPIGARLAVSPDGRSLLYEQVDQRGSDLMLVENFR